MATKKFIIEVEEGNTQCNECPFTSCKYICVYGKDGRVIVDCDQHNLATMKITEYDDNDGKALLYAVEKTAERTKKEMIEKAVEWLDKNVNNYCYNTGGRFEYIPKVGKQMLKQFKQAMEDE